jgi:hypothetical protein
MSRHALYRDTEKCGWVECSIPAGFIQNVAVKASEVARSHGLEFKAVKMDASDVKIKSLEVFGDPGFSLETPIVVSGVAGYCLEFIGKHDGCVYYTGDVSCEDVPC